MDYNDYFERGTITKVNIIEKKDIRLFLEFTYKDNLKVSKDLIISYPRWSIISGYYAMHDISKLYLLLDFDLKFSKPSVHDAVIKALKELVKKEKIISLIEKGDSEFARIQKLDYFLAKGKSNREKTQYYTMLSFSEEDLIDVAQSFYKNIVVPYIKIVEKLLVREK